MASARTLFNHGYHISALQRNAASLFWGQLIHRERKIAQANMPSIEPLQAEMLQLLEENDPTRIKTFTKELDSLIFENRHKPLEIKSTSLPEGILLEAAKRCKIPLAVFPNNVSMTFTDNNNIRVNDKQYTASQIINEKLGLFPKLQQQGASLKGITTALSSKNLFHTLKTKPALLTLGLAGALVGGLVALSSAATENDPGNTPLIGYTP